MPQYKRPFDKGHLLIKFKVEFPSNHFTDESTLKVNCLIYYIALLSFYTLNLNDHCCNNIFFRTQLLETLLPPRPDFQMPTGDNVEEVDLNDHHPTEYSATQESDDEDEPHGARVGCAQQ